MLYVLSHTFRQGTPLVIRKRRVLIYLRKQTTDVWWRRWRTPFLGVLEPSEKEGDSGDALRENDRFR
jgi:hypothetical protein